MEEKVPNWDIGPGTCKQIRMASGFANLKLVFRAVEAPNWDLHPVSKLETCSLWAKKIQIGICVREQLSRPAAQGAGFAIYSEASFLRSKSPKLGFAPGVVRAVRIACFVITTHHPITIFANHPLPTRIELIHNVFYKWYLAMKTRKIYLSFE